MQQLLAADTGQPVERISRDINRDYWMSAVEAKEYGLIDTIVGATDATVAADRAEAALDEHLRRTVKTDYHPVGTCRMGKDPKTSVIDADHRTHDVPNLFIVDGSSFVTSGRGQPTMTIQALAFRAADRITQFAIARSI